MSLEDVVKNVKHLPIKQIYKDVAKAPLKEVSSIVTNAIKSTRWALAPLDYLAAQNDRYQAFLKRVADKIPESNVISPPPLVVGKVLEGLKFREENELLTETFVNLLAAACDRDKQQFVHPAFPTIIDQLCRDEAAILYYAKKEILTFRRTEPTINIWDGTLRFTDFNFPIESLYIKENLAIYLEHMVHLQLVMPWLSNRIDITPPLKVDFYPFGRLFASACIPDEMEDFI